MDLAGKARGGQPRRDRHREQPCGLGLGVLMSPPRTRRHETPREGGDSFADPGPSHSAGATHAWDSCAFRRADRDPPLALSPWGDNEIPRRPSSLRKVGHRGAPHGSRRSRGRAGTGTCARRHPHQCLGTRRPRALEGPRNFPQDLRRGPMAESAQGRGSAWGGAQCISAESAPHGFRVQGMPEIASKFEELWSDCPTSGTIRDATPPLIPECGTSPRRHESPAAPMRDHSPGQNLARPRNRFLRHRPRYIFFRGYPTEKANMSRKCPGETERVGRGPVHLGGIRPHGFRVQ